MRLLALLTGALVLSACATAKMHGQEALNSVALGCGMSYGEIFQDEEEKKLLFTMRTNISANQRACVARWAKRNHLTAVFVSLEGPVG